MEQRPESVSPTTLITRAAVIRQIEACMDGALSDKALAAWAFDRFYAEELGAEQYEAGAAETMSEVLDTLMFGDTPNFRLDQETLRELIVQLQAV